MKVNDREEIKTEMVRKEIQIDSGEWLVCPSCGENYLHQRWVREYDRAGEDGDTTVTEVYGTKVRTVNADSERNPSRRRDGIRIAFSCECCTAHVELIVAQHKGFTEIYTEHLPGAYKFDLFIEHKENWGV